MDLPQTYTKSKYKPPKKITTVETVNTQDPGLATSLSTNILFIL